MSYFVTGIVRRARLPRILKQRPELKAVALALADRAHDDGRNAWPSVATIAAESEISERTAQKCLKVLMASGLILEQERPRQRMPRKYAFDLDAWIVLDPDFLPDQGLAPQDAAPLTVLPPQHAAPLSHFEGLAADIFGLGAQDQSSAPQLPSSGVQNPASAPQTVAPDPVLMNGHSWNSHKNGRSHSKKSEDGDKFEAAKAIAKKHVSETSSRSVAHACTIQDCYEKGIDVDTASRAFEHHAALKAMRDKFAHRKAVGA